MARNVNSLIVQNWDYWEDIFTFPFERDIGNGDKIKCEDEDELFEFLLNSKKGAYMWRGHEDFSVLCNAYQFQIKLITVTHTNDENPTVTIIEPNPDFADFSNCPAGNIPEMILFHVKNTHYDLIVPKSNRLALEGGLDYQRKNKLEEIDTIQEKKDDNAGEASDSKEETTSMAEQITILEVKL